MVLVKNYLTVQDIAEKEPSKPLWIVVENVIGARTSKSFGESGATRPSRLKTSSLTSRQNWPNLYNWLIGGCINARETLNESLKIRPELTLRFYDFVEDIQVCIPLNSSV